MAGYIRQTARELQIARKASKTTRLHAHRQLCARNCMKHADKTTPTHTVTHKHRFIHLDMRTYTKYTSSRDFPAALCVKGLQLFTSSNFSTRVGGTIPAPIKIASTKPHLHRTTDLRQFSVLGPLRFQCELLIRLVGDAASDGLGWWSPGPLSTLRPI